MPERLTAPRLIVRTAWYYRQTNLAVILGVAVGTAVIGGALIIGDSVRASLREMTLARLGAVDDVLSGPRFFTEKLASALQQVSTDATIAPAIVMVAAVRKTGGDNRSTDDRLVAEAGPTQRSAGQTVRRASQVNVYGVNAASWALVGGGSNQWPEGDGAVINGSLAAALDAQIGDTVTIWIELPSAVPRDTLLGKKDNDAQEVTVRVTAILADGVGPPRFGLQPTQQLPLNVFVALKTLQEALDLEEVRPTRRDPTSRPARVNTLLVSRSPQLSQSPEFGATLAERLRRVWQLEDLHLRLVTDDVLGVLSVESEQMLLESKLAEGVLAEGRERSLPLSPVLVYLANWLRHPEKPKAYAMYSTVAGLDVLSLAEKPFGPWEFLGPKPDALGENDVIINEFLAEDLQVRVGDSFRFAYHQVGSQGELPEIERTATVRGIVRMTGAAIDRRLTPDVRGITDAKSLGEWDQPFPMKLDEVTPRDDEYWDSYRATPKAFFRLDTAQALWPSRYGNLTSIRVAPRDGQSLDELRAEFGPGVLARLEPESVGMGFLPVKAIGLQAAQGATDFTGLFVGFSLFLIASAVILVGLLFRLAIEQRTRQWGLLGALGMPPGHLRWWMLGEGALLAVMGGLLGAALAVGYAQLMLYGLKTWWIGAIGTRFLFLSIEPGSVMLGVLIAGGASFAAMAAALRQLGRLSLRQQLQGDWQTIDVEREQLRGRAAGRKAVAAAVVALGLIAGVITGWIPATEAFGGLSWPIVCFFLSGLLLLAAGLWGVSNRLAAPRGLAVRGRGSAAWMRLGWRNLGRSRSRSVLTTGLIASAAFLIAAVAAGQKNPVKEQPDRRSGNGGFTLVAESSSPILYDLNTAEGRGKVNLQAQTPAQQAALDTLRIIPFRVQPGEDASCLNLFQARTPTILGVPPTMITRGGFAFVGAGTPRPWELLTAATTTAESSAIPVLGDNNTLLFGLKKPVGSILPIPSAERPEHHLRIVGALDGSVFQGVLLMSEDQFLRVFPERKGFQYFLIDVPGEHAAAAAELLETELAEYGFDTEPVAERLARFLAVQNTYLSTFQALGGFGLLLGTLGLATVMLRNVLERHSELALLRAVGCQPRQLAGLVLWETLTLLGWGLLVGTGAALLAMAPHLMSAGADVPWLSGSVLLTAVLLAGLLAAAVAVRAALVVPIVATLRGQ